MVVQIRPANRPGVSVSREGGRECPEGLPAARPDAYLQPAAALSAWRSLVVPLLLSLATHGLVLLESLRPPELAPVARPLQARLVAAEGRQPDRPAAQSPLPLSPPSPPSSPRPAPPATRAKAPPPPAVAPPPQLAIATPATPPTSATPAPASASPASPPPAVAPAGPGPATPSPPGARPDSGTGGAREGAPAENAVSPDTLRAYTIALGASAGRLRRYPALARERGWEGRVEVVVALLPGMAQPRVSLKQSSGHELLDEQALRMVRGAVDNVPLPEGLRGRTITVRLPVEFSLAAE